MSLLLRGLGAYELIPLVNLNSQIRYRGGLNRPHAVHCGKVDAKGMSVGGEMNYAGFISYLNFHSTPS